MAQLLRIIGETRAAEDRPQRQEKQRIGVVAAVIDSIPATKPPHSENHNRVHVIYWGRDKMRKDGPPKFTPRPLSNYAKQLHNEHFKGWGIDLQPHQEIHIPATAIKTRLEGTCCACAKVAATQDYRTPSGKRLGFCSSCWDKFNGR